MPEGERASSAQPDCQEGHASPLLSLDARSRKAMKAWPWTLLCVSLVLGSTPPARAQFFAECSSGSQGELERNIRAHEEHMTRLQKKLITGRYWQGPLPTNVKPVDLEGVRASLSRMSRRAAVLFHAYNQQSRKFCVWLISAGAAPASEVIPLERIEDLRSLRPRLMATLRVTTRSLPVRKGEMTKAEFDQEMAALDRELAGIEDPRRRNEDVMSVAKLLLPGKILGAMSRAGIDTLIVIPVFDLGVIPYSALPIGGERMLIDAVSVLVAPGFFVFVEAPRPAKRDFTGALIVGNPYRDDPDWHLARLPGAEAEAREVAGMFGVQPLIGAMATRSAVLAGLRSAPAPQLIYFAAHGVADDANPLDGGFLALSDVRWTGRDIVGQAPRDMGRPLVVLSACQTGLGKNFDVGTIGLARAWHEVGASNVVMSLWLVGDRDTQLLMTRFMRYARGTPPDKALRQAMLERRREDPRITAWAGFAVFGAPEL
jgi:CHAT domain-containing protein